MTDIQPWLSGLQAAEFLANDWQRQPRFFAAALPDVPAPPDWRALAARDDVETRRIVTSPTTGYLASQGPYSGPDPVDPWTVLIQDADYHAPALATLFDALPFLPRWRHEDIMMSVAVAGGSVGPHVDRYDVFLVQARGERHWQVGHRDTAVPDPDCQDLRLVKPFAADFEVTAGPGDVLYLPPGVPHHGVASGHCVTYSIGFRAPALQDLIAVLLSYVDGQALLSDAGRAPASHALGLDRATLNAARDQVRALLDDDTTLALALGELVTEPKDWIAARAHDASDEDSSVVQGDAQILKLAKGARLATYASDGQHWLFANGARYDLNTAAERGLIAALSDASRISPHAHRGAQTLLDDLVDGGVLAHAAAMQEPET